MGFLQSLVSKLFPKSDFVENEPWNPDALDYREMPVDTIWHALGLEEKASNQGKQDLPSSDSIVLDAVEREIKQFVEGRVGKIMVRLESAVAGVENTISSKNISDMLQSLLGIPGKFTQQLKKMDRDIRHKIEEAERILRDKEQAVNEIQTRYSVNRDARFDEPRSYQWAMLILATLLEGIVNAYFFRQGMTTGLIGGFVFAFLLAGLDVSIVFWFGRWIPWAFAAKGPQRVVGWFSGIAAAMWVGGYNLLTSHIREQLGQAADLTSASEQALASFQESLFGLTQADSWLLFVSGIFFSLGAIWAGIKWDDFVPGYGKAWRDRTLARKEIEAIHAFLRSRAHQMFTEAMDDIDEIADRSDQAVQSIEVQIRLKNQLRTVVKECAAHHSETGNALISRYRSVNEQFRTTPPPKRFNQLFEFELREAVVSGVEQNEQFLNVQKSERDKCRQKVPQIRTEVEGIFEVYEEKQKAIIDSYRDK